MHKLLQIANSAEPVQDGRIFIELINWPTLHDLKANPTEQSRSRYGDCFLPTALPGS